MPFVGYKLLELSVSMEIKFSKRFTKQYDKVPQQIQKAFLKRLEVFSENQLHPTLRNHSLTGEYSGWRSINVTGDWRALFREFDGEVIFFDFIGTHSQLYS